MFFLRQALVFGLAAVSVVQAATWANVLTDLQQADLTTQQILSQCQNYTGTAQQSSTLTGTVKKHEVQIQQATTDVQNSPVPTPAQFQQVLSFLCGQALTNLKNALACLKGKKALFERAGIRTGICQELVKLRAYFKSLFDALIAQAPTAALKQQATNCKAQYDAAFADILANLC